MATNKTIKPDKKQASGENTKNWFETDLQKDIWAKKYCVDDESFEGFLDRLAPGDTKLKELIRDKKFLFGGRILAGRGQSNNGRKITYSNCYVISPPEDNIESIFECASKLARTYSYGGGCGVDISGLSPSGARINNAAKATTGSISFMDLYSLVTDLIGQSGRRGALMISLDCAHPDLLRFIDVKSDLSKVTKANISIRMSDAFMEAAVEDKPWRLHFKREETGETVEKTVSADEVLSKIAFNNWDMAEPGALFWDRIKNWNLLSEDDEFAFAGVNPCAEEPLPAGGSCLLGSINLSEFVVDPMTDHASFDYEALKEAVKTAVVGLNDVLEEGLPLHPLAEQRESVAKWRQIGLGIMGLGDTLIKLGLRYGSPESLAECDKIGFIMADTAIYQSAMLAKEYGAYDGYKQDCVFASAYFNENTTPETREAVKQYGLRNSQMLTIAPTGSISTMLGISGGIEPIFNISYTRKTESLHGEDKYYQVFTPIVKEYMDKHGIEDEADLPDFFVTAMTLDYKERIRMQSVWQKHIDASISSTVNVPGSFTVEDVKDLYKYAWENELKGVTLYRDGCRRSGILTSTPKADAGAEKEAQYDSIMPISRGSIGKTYGATTKNTTACGSLYVTINRDSEGHIVESFVNTSKGGICKSNIDGMNRLISLALRSGVMVDEIIDQLKHINCAACVRTQARGTKLDGMSCPDIIAKALEMEYSETFSAMFPKEQVKDSKPQAAPATKVPPAGSAERNSLTTEGITCPDCGVKLQHEGGCVTCTSCGWSRCM